MEVVLLEYSIRGFIPIILASVAGAIVSRAVFGSATAFDVPALDMHSLLEVPFILLLGLLAGVVAAGFIRLMKQLQRLNTLPLPVKWGGLTLTTILLSLYLPEVLGIGYDTVNDALAGKVVIGMLAGLLLAKLFLGAWAAAVGFPVGLIGPTLFIGAGTGRLVWPAVGPNLFSSLPLSVGFYAMLGMGALMGATLRAPLAALVALLELTANPNIIMPGMLVIVVAGLVVSEGLPSAVGV